MASASSEKPKSWSELPLELVSSIMLQLGAVDILESAQKVCSLWRRVSKDPSIWRKIDMRDVKRCERSKHEFDRICRIAINRSEDGLEEIKLWKFANDSLFNYIANRSSNLRSLTLDITNDRFVHAFVNLPLLEELDVTKVLVFDGKLDLNTIGHYCPRLKTLKLHCLYGFCTPSEGDDDALAIAESMPELRHLQIHGNGLTEIGLNAIFDNCPHLQHLGVGEYYFVNLVGDLEKRRLEMTKVLRRFSVQPHVRPFN